LSGGIHDWLAPMPCLGSATPAVATGRAQSSPGAANQGLI